MFDPIQWILFATVFAFFEFFAVQERCTERRTG